MIYLVNQTEKNATAVAIAAPIAPYLGINAQFKTIFNSADTIVDIAGSFVSLQQQKC